MCMNIIRIFDGREYMNLYGCFYHIIGFQMEIPKLYKK